jgi:magnesium transporter
MLTCHGKRVSTGAAAQGDASLHEALWLDLLDPTAEERQRAEQALGMHLPDREGIAGVELSRRIVRDGDALRLNVPYFTNGDDTEPTPLGLILTPQCLVSLRYSPSSAFEQAAERLREKPADGSAGAFATLVEAIVGNIADHLEDLAANVGKLSSHLFGERRHDGPLRVILGMVGRIEARLTRARLTSTGLLRVVMFAHESGLEWLAKPELARLRSAQKDLEVLCELDTQLTDKLQFLLDAALGFISIEQNDVMKVFTVASVAAIPPVILAGIWGMNFQRMPELHLPYGYALALAAIALSIAVPLFWFKRRGWI